MNATLSTDIAQTILNQLGGRQFLMLTASKLMVSETSLTCKVGSNPNNIAAVKITLTDDDLYTVTAYKWRGRPRVMTEVIKHEGLFCDMLQDEFEEITGLYVTFGKRK